MEDGQRGRTGQPLRLLVVVGAEDRRRHHHAGLVQHPGLPEVRAVEIERLVDQGGGEVEGEAEREPEHPRQLGAEGRRAEQPHLGQVATAGHRCRTGRRAVVVHQVSDELDDVLGEPLGTYVRPTPQCTGRVRIGARGAPEAEVDPAGVQSLERGELLGHDQWCVIGEHDATCADPQRGGGVGQVPDEHGGCGTGHRGHPVVFGHPHAVVAEGLDHPGQPGGVGQGVRRRRALGHGGEVQHGEGRHGRNNARGFRLLPPGWGAVTRR